MDFSDAKQLAYDELEKWNLLEKGWVVKPTKGVTTAGRCVYAKKEIEISQPIFEHESYDFCLDTIRHEIAHALDDSNDAPHGDTWKRLAVMVGCDPSATFDSEVVDKLILDRCKYVMVYGTKIVQTYMRKPNRKTILNIADYWATGHKAETKGKLQIHVYDPNIHVERM